MIEVLKDNILKSEETLLVSKEWKNGVNVLSLVMGVQLEQPCSKYLAVYVEVAEPSYDSLSDNQNYVSSISTFD